MKTFKLAVLLKDQDDDFNYRYGKTLTLLELGSNEAWEARKENLINYLDTVRDELIERYDGEEFGGYEEDGDETDKY